MGGLQKKKYESGSATNYISRNKARKKLSLSLADFREIIGGDDEDGDEDDAGGDEDNDDDVGVEDDGDLGG
ncbi:hypothetical protein QTP86_032033 [Hemibagrus guttatus]|nr:hypothetical protein QTP86_032033 [Hemibagrus guttatus]